MLSASSPIRLTRPARGRALGVGALRDAQEFFVYGGRVTEVAILAAGADDAPAVATALRRRLAARRGDGGVEVHTWRDMQPELVQFVFLDDAGMYILLVILVVVVGFGILNTINDDQDHQ